MKTKHANHLLVRVLSKRRQGERAGESGERRRTGRGGWRGEVEIPR